MKKILLTGASGFLGINARDFLVEKGYFVVGVGRKNIDVKIDNYKYIKADLSKADEFIKLSFDFDYIVHCAALSTDDGFFNEYEKSNIILTKNLVDFAKKNLKLKRIVNISTPSIYFNCNSKKDVLEEEVLDDFINDYAKTKYEAEKIIRNSKLNNITLRPRAIYGEYDNTLLPRILKISKKGIPLFKNGNCYADFTYVKNVCYAIYLAINASNEFSNNSYNVTDGKSLRLIEIFKILENELKEEFRYKKLDYKLVLKIASIVECISKFFFIKPPITKYAISVLGNSQTLDISKIKKDLKYKPIYSTKEGVFNFAKWYRNK